MINKILKIIEGHTILDKDLQKVIKAEYPYKETLASDIEDLFALYGVSNRRELLTAFLRYGKQRHYTPLTEEQIEALVNDFEGSL